MMADRKALGTSLSQLSQVTTFEASTLSLINQVTSIKTSTYTQLMYETKILTASVIEAIEKASTSEVTGTCENATIQVHKSNKKQKIKLFI